MLVQPSAGVGVRQGTTRSRRTCAQQRPTPSCPSPMTEHEIQPRADAAPVSGRPVCFVMMPFQPLFYEYHRRVFVPAIEDAGLAARRSDDVHSHDGTVTGDIRALVTRSVVCMADLTGNSRNVIYEVGLAHGLDKPVVLLAQSPENVPAELHDRRIVYYQ